MSDDGFVSYSHGPEGLLAPRLRAGLQRFAKPWWQRSFDVPLEFLDSVEFIDHDHLLVGFDDGSTIVLTLDVEELKSIAISRLTRGFTQQECTQYDIEPCPTLEDLRG